MGAMNPDSQADGVAARPEPVALQATLFDFAIAELVRQHRDSFAPLWSVESWAKLLIWLALNCGCAADPASLEAFAAALGPRLTGRMRRVFFGRELENLNLQLMADPAEPRLLLLPIDGLGPLPAAEAVTAALEGLELAPLLCQDKTLWQWQADLLAIPWRA
jgi:hypothetical protein